jgi:hypothetical protein
MENVEETVEGNILTIKVYLRWNPEDQLAFLEFTSPPLTRCMQL